MFGVFETDPYGAMTWIATVDTTEEADEIAIDRREQLKDECCVMVMPLHLFHQEGAVEGDDDE